MSQYKGTKSASPTHEPQARNETTAESNPRKVDGRGFPASGQESKGSVVSEKVIEAPINQDNLFCFENAAVGFRLMPQTSGTIFLSEIMEVCKWQASAFGMDLGQSLSSFRAENGAEDHFLLSTML